MITEIAIITLVKKKDIFEYINLFVVYNIIKLGREYSQKELIWYANRIIDEKQKKIWMSEIKKYFGNEFIKDFNCKQYRSY